MKNKVSGERFTKFSGSFKRKSLLLCIPITGLLFFLSQPSKKENILKDDLMDFIESQDSKLSIENKKEFTRRMEIQKWFRLSDK